MPRKDKVIHISNLPSTFRGNITRNGRFIQNGIPPLGGAYDKVAKSTGLIRLGNEFLYNGINNLVSKDNREKLMNNTAGRLINYVKDFNKESFPNDDELGPTFPFNIIQTPKSNGKKLPQKQYAVGGKIPNVVAGGIAQPLGNNFFYMNGRKHSQGGIDIGPSDKTGIEVEGGEVVETNGNELKVYSAQPIINGVSPAKLVMGGANPNKVFKAQEDFKDRNRINDDGTKYKEGGKIYQAPNEYKRQIAESGSIIIGGYPTIAGNRNYKFIKGLTKASRIGRTATNFINLGRQKIYDLANKIDNTWINQGIKEVYRTTIGKHGSNLPRTIDYINKNNINENKKAMGGLSRDKDYGSKKKPYPSVAKKDFAGGHRSYPIPTKADAVDALRLAGLHGRSDVKAKVYNKYPELRKKGNAGLVVSINGNVKNGLIHSPSSTGGLRDKFVVGGNRINRNGITLEYDEQTGAYVPITNPTTLSVSTSTPNQGTKYSDSKGQGKFKNLTTADWIGLGSNVAGSLASYFASRRAINKMRGPGQPTLISASKLKTKYNINPQLDRIRENKFEAYRDIDSNTASSRVSLARKQRARNAAGQAANELYGNKENIETNLINQDRRNQQSVRQFNAQQYNQYIDRKTAFDNGIREAKVTNINNLFSGINAGIQDMISRYENRKALNNTIGAMRASAPNVDDRIMKDAGVDYDEFIIRKRRKLGGKQSCQ